MILVTSGVVGGAWELVELVGLPLLFVIFVLKGLLIGKIFPTSLFLPGYVFLVGASRSDAALVVVVTTVAYVLGQLFIYRGTNRYGMGFVDRLPYAKVPDVKSPRFKRFDAWFIRYGGLAVFGSNFVPWVRGLATFPAATSSYSLPRYALYTAAGTFIYHTLYVWLALLGLEWFLGRE